MKRVTRRRSLGLGAVGTAALLAACRGGGASAPAARSSPGKPRSGGQLAVRITTDPYDWDPTDHGDVPNSQGIGHAYDSLVNFRSGPGVDYDDLVLQPALAERWESPDAQTFTFHLRAGVKFADLAPLNGRALTAADVKWTFEYESRTGQFAATKLPPAQNAALLQGIDRVETPNDSTAVVHFAKPFAPFLTYAGGGTIPIVPREIFDRDGSLKDRIAGTGPWQLDTASSQKGTRWVWKRNPGYWDRDKPYIDQLTWLVIADDATADAAFQTKQVDLRGGSGDTLTPDGVPILKRGFPSAVISTGLVPPMHLYMMVTKPPLSDIRVRRALSLSIDRDEFTRVMTAGQGGWALAGSFPSTFTQTEIKQMLKYDPAQARQLLAQAGYTNGLDLEFIYPSNSLGNSELQKNQLLQAQLKQSGINLNLKALDKQDWERRKAAHDYQVATNAAIPAADIDSYFTATFYPGSPQNYGNIDDPELTSMIDAQRGEPDQSKRRDIVRSAVRRINVDMVWALGLYYRVVYQAWNPRLQNYGPIFGFRGLPLQASWLAD